MEGPFKKISAKPDSRKPPFPDSMVSRTLQNGHRNDAKPSVSTIQAGGHSITPDRHHFGTCKTLIETISSPKRDRQMTAAIEIQESVDISEYIRYGDKDREDTLKRIEAGWPGSIWIGVGPNLPPSLRWIVKTTQTLNSIML